MDHYRRESAKIIGVFKEIIPEAEIEKASIDEAFVDFSIPVRSTLLERYPILAQVPEDLDTPLPPAPVIDWGDLSTVIPVNPDEADKQEGASTSRTPDPEPAPTWHDVALSIGAELMAKVRREVREKLGYTMSAVRHCSSCSCALLTSANREGHCTQQVSSQGTYCPRLAISCLLTRDA